MLYLFRGHEREWVNLHEDSSRGGRSIVDAYLELYAAGLVGDIILVCPGISSADHKVPGLLVDFKQPELARSTRGVDTGRFETYFIMEFIRYVDQNYRTIPDRSARGVDGFSLGGFQAIKIAAQHPHLFNSAGAYDGTFFYATTDGQRVSPQDRLFHAGLFDPAFGRPRDYVFAARHNPANLIMNGRQADLAGIFWMLQAGPESAEPGDSNFYRSRYVAGLLAARGIPNQVPLVIPNGKHNWATADHHMSITLPLHWQCFMTASTAPFPIVNH